MYMYIAFSTCALEQITTNYARALNHHVHDWQVHKEYARALNEHVLT